MLSLTPKQRQDRRDRVYAHANPYEGDAYALDPHGHGWDRLAALSGEYARGERTWAETKRLLDENAADLTRLMHEATLSDIEQAVTTP